MARYAIERFATSEELRDAIERALARRGEPVTRAQIALAVREAARLESSESGADPALGPTAPLDAAPRATAREPSGPRAASRGRSSRWPLLIAALAFVAALAALAAAFLAPLR
jgi:hypothetical protein